MNYYNDNDPFCCAVLRERMADGLIPEGVIDERDFRTIDYRELGQYRQVHLFAGIGGFALAARMAGWPDDRELWTAGFPCQPVSVAGKRLAQEDERWLWPWLARALREVQPGLVMLENVPGLFHSGFGDVLGGLAEGGFNAEWGVVSAAAVGAPHLRERVWILAYPGERRRQDNELQARWPSSGRGSPADVADTEGTGLEGAVSTRRSCANGQLAECGEAVADTKREPTAGRNNGSERRVGSQGDAGEGGWTGAGVTDGWWAVEPNVGRVAHGIPARVDRLRSLGNSIVPQVAAQILREYRCSLKAR